MARDLLSLLSHLSLMNISSYIFDSFPSGISLGPLEQDRTETAMTDAIMRKLQRFISTQLRIHS